MCVYMVEPPHQRLKLDDAPISGQDVRLTKPASIILYTRRGDWNCCVDTHACVRLTWVNGMLPLPFSLWRRARMIIMPDPRSHTGSTSLSWASRLNGHLALQVRSCFAEFLAGVSPTPTSPRGRLILECVIGYPTPSCTLFLSSFLCQQPSNSLPKHDAMPLLMLLFLIYNNIFPCNRSWL